MAKQINPAQYIAFIDKMNELEQAAKKIKKFGLPTTVGDQLSKAFEDYSIQWDSMTDRWTLVSETDAAPDLCSFNQTADECSTGDLCERCFQVAQQQAEDYDNEKARRGY